MCACVCTCTHTQVSTLMQTCICTHHIDVKNQKQEKSENCLCSQRPWLFMLEAELIKKKILELTKDYSNGSGYKVSVPKPVICFRSK